MHSLDEHANAQIAAFQVAGLRRVLQPTERRAAAGPVVERAGRRLVSFSCNDYLNLATDPRVIEASVRATRQYGTGAGASRLITGDNPLYGLLEEKLAALKHTQSACVFGSGYLANTGTIPALVGRGDLILADSLVHSSIWTGALLSGARIQRFLHNDAGQLEERLSAGRRSFRRVLILTETVFSMDGDVAPLAAFSRIAEAHDAWLMADDAHGLGVLPQDRLPVPVKMGTLSKAAGSYGGYVCASSAVIGLLRSAARTLIYTTGLPPAALAAAIASVDIIASEPDLVARPLAHARLFAEAAGLDVPDSPIIPIILGGSEQTIAAAAMLESAGFLVAPIRPPTVPAGTARLRLTFTAQHTEADILSLAALVRELRP